MRWVRSGSARLASISEATGKGRHTTTSAELIRLDEETFVADTPGIRSLAMHGVPPEVLDQPFPGASVRIWDGASMPIAGICPNRAVRCSMRSRRAPSRRSDTKATRRSGAASEDCG